MQGDTQLNGFYVLWYATREWEILEVYDGKNGKRYARLLPPDKASRLASNFPVNGDLAAHVPVELLSPLWVQRGDIIYEKGVEYRVENVYFKDNDYEVFRVERDTTTVTGANPHTERKCLLKDMLDARIIDNAEKTE
jgi:hypothetical protein